MRSAVLTVALLFCLSVSSQDTAYARKVIQTLASKACFGRGYQKKGLAVAAAHIVAELNKTGCIPLLGPWYQPFTFDVNTFPEDILLKINGKALKPGADFIVGPESGSLKGRFALKKKDSLTYFANEKDFPLVLNVKKKLTYSVATASEKYCSIDILASALEGEPKEAELKVKSKLLKAYPNQNICAFIEGTRTDSMLIFSAHYDHLGGMGKSVFFPGANDNASGVSVLLNLARYYTANPPAYRTVFVFFAGEEAGLIGSKFFVDQKTVDLTRIRFLINLDLLGTGDEGIMVVNGAVHTKEFELLTAINAEKQLVKEVKKRGKARNSDHYWFSEAGVPAFFIYTLGGTTSYHDIYDTADQLPLTDYVDVFRLITEFASRL